MGSWVLIAMTRSAEMSCNTARCLPIFACSIVLRRKSPSFRVRWYCFQCRFRQSSLGCLIHHSIPRLKAAKPPADSKAACGPARRAIIAPVRNPAYPAFCKSLFALSPSIQHSVPEYMPPIIPKFFAEENDERPISRRPIRSCWRMGRSVRDCAVAVPAAPAAPVLTGRFGLAGFNGDDRGVS